MKEIELLAPAGDFESLKSAILYGADAVYLGSFMFGMRVVAAKFDFDILNKAIVYAHSKGVKIYLTCNTIPSNEEMLQLKSFLQTVSEIGIDGLIVADIGVFMQARKLAPKLPIHVSTQFGVFNFQTAQELFKLGAKRVVLARELSLEDINIIRQKTSPDLQLEVFVHGSMCVSVSGRCLISQYLLGRDANRGNCAQPCRWSYSLIENTRPNEFFEIVETNRGSYILNSKDLNLIRKISYLKQAGVCSFKIEGRAKSAYYVGTVTNAYRVAINDLLKSSSCGEKFNLQPWVISELEKVSHRPYFEGFLFNKPNLSTTESQNYRTGGYVRTCEVVAVVNSFDENGLFCTQKNKFSVGDVLEIVLVGKQPVSFKVENLFDENGNVILNAPHAQMKVFIKCQMEEFDDNLALEGCFLRRNFNL